MSEWRSEESYQELINHTARTRTKRSLAVTRIIQIKKAGSAIKLFGFQSWLYCLLWRLGQVNQPLWFSEGL